MPPAFNLSQDQTLKFDSVQCFYNWPYFSLRDLRRFLLGVALHLLATPSHLHEMTRPDQAPTPIGCLLFKERVAYCFLLSRCLRTEVRFAARGAHSTHPFGPVKQFAKLFFARRPTHPICRKPASSLDLQQPKICSKALQQLAPPPSSAPRP